MAYATATDLLKRYDARVLGDLINDAGVRQTPTQMLTDANILAALSDATSTINSAVLLSDRYTVVELQLLTGDDAALLVRLCCDIAYCLLVQRRGTDVKTLSQCQKCEETLNAIRDGLRVFNIQANKDAGLTTRGFPSTQTFANLNLERDYAGKFFPVRRQQDAT